MSVENIGKEWEGQGEGQVEFPVQKWYGLRARYVIIYLGKV